MRPPRVCFEIRPFPYHWRGGCGVSSLRDFLRDSNNNNQRGVDVGRKSIRRRFSTICRLSLKMIEIMTHKITLLPGDGIGPEVANAARQIVEASGVSVEWEVIAAPLEGGKRVGEFPREQAVESVRH